MLFSAGETTWLLRSLLACDEATAVVTWSTVFGVTIWYCRRFRNQRIFANDSMSHTCPLNVIQSLVADIKRTNEVDGGACSNMNSILCCPWQLMYWNRNGLHGKSSVNLGPTLDIDNLKDPDQFFFAFERLEEPMKTVNNVELGAPVAFPRKVEQ
ncbi:hypothetical protein D5086_001626 [Populus alba]|uniref:Uncharacterized protein n=1 Tax=Populus alba TaxID=43335 RepID=A0ACC4CZ70_POPAL